MVHSIEKLKYKLEYSDGHAGFVSLNGYAFIDENGSTIIIVYGEGRRDAMSKYLTDDGDSMNIKYKTIKL